MTRASDRVVLVHAGIPKTGSSAIQSFLLENRHLLIESGVFVPQYPSGLTHRAYKSLFDSRRTLLNSAVINRPGGGRPQNMVAFRLRAGASLVSTISETLVRRPRVVVFTAEQFSYAHGPRVAKSLFRVFSAFGSHVQVTMYLRDPIGWLASKALQSLKRGVCNSPREALVLVPRLQAFSRHSLRFSGSLPRCRQYDRGCFQNRDVRRDFFSWAFPELSPDAFRWNPVDQNPSLSVEEGIVLADLREKYFPSAPDGVRIPELERVRQLLSMRPRPESTQIPQLSIDLLCSLRDELEPDSDWIERSGVVGRPDLKFRFPEAAKRNVNGLRELESMSHSSRVRAMFQYDPAEVRSLKNEVEGSMNGPSS